MRRVRDVIRMRAAGLPRREIARRIRVAPSTVRLTVPHFESAGLSWPLPDDLTEVAHEVAACQCDVNPLGRNRREISAVGVSLSLNAYTEVNAPAHAAAMNENAIPPSRLLVVDDIAENRAVLKRYFDRRNFEVVEAGDGAQALELVKQQSFDAVLLDVVMPGLNGFDVLKEIRTIYPASVLPVIMVTAKVESEDVAMALELGANDYVTKPVDFRIAWARLQSQLARVRAEQTLVQHLEMLEKINQRLEHEIAERKQSEAVMRHMAQHDSLTGLVNRRQFRERLGNALAEVVQSGTAVALLFLDLDQFKLINDTLGHGVGDLLLVAIAKRLQRATRDCDTVARLGGDEFAVIQRVTDVEKEASTLADRIIGAIMQPFQIEGNSLAISCSVGLACAPSDGDDPESLLANADLALYRAKDEARGNYRFFEREMGERATSQRQLENDLRRAVQEDQFLLHYQPLLDLKSGKITGFEALIRWNHPVEGLISPLQFIPVAEKTGLILPISQWVLREACMEAACWPPEIKLAINLSPVHFRTETLLRDVKEALFASHLDPRRLELEITETVLIDDEIKTMQWLHRLRELGIHISMDDFGTGYSSLSYLRMFPFDKIKIDRSFVRDLPSDNGCTAIVRAIIGLANNLGMTTTAEGVETDHQITCLRSEGCNEAQGYLISKPLAADQARSMALRRRPQTAIA